MLFTVLDLVTFSVDTSPVAFGFDLREQLFHGGFSIYVVYPKSARMCVKGSGQKSARSGDENTRGERREQVGSRSSVERRKGAIYRL